MLNITINYLFLSSTLHSPLFTSTRSSTSCSLSNCKFNRFFNNLYRSSTSLVKERVRIRKSKIYSFIATPLDLSPDYFDEIIKDRIKINPNDSVTSLTIVDCTFTSIVSNERGAAIRIAKEIPLFLNDTQFLEVVSRYEAAILFVLIGQDTWSLQPINIYRCYFESCYSTGEYFEILDDYTDKYPSVLIHDFLGFRFTSIESSISEVSAKNCQNNQCPMKRFGAYIHHHANTFQLNHFNCTNVNKKDSSQIFFTQSHKQASNVFYVLAIGQAGYSMIEIKDIQSTDQLTFQYFDIYNSTLFTEELVISENKTEHVKTDYALIDFGGDYSGSVVFIYCHFYSIVTDNKGLQPILAFSSNGRLPIFANCFSDVDSIASDQGFTYGTPFQETSIILTETPTNTFVETLSEIPSQTIITNAPNEVIKKVNKKKNVIVISIVIVAAVIVTVVALVIAKYYIYRNITFIEETDESSYGRKELIDVINPNANTHDPDDPYTE